jgi:hypothetical protein
VLVVAVDQGRPTLQSVRLAELLAGTRYAAAMEHALLAGEGQELRGRRSSPQPCGRAASQRRAAHAQLLHGALFACKPCSPAAVGDGTAELLRPAAPQCWLLAALGTSAACVM